MGTAWADFCLLIADSNRQENGVYAVTVGERRQINLLSSFQSSDYLQRNIGGCRYPLSQTGDYFPFTIFADGIA